MRKNRLLFHDKKVAGFGSDLGSSCCPYRVEQFRKLLLRLSLAQFFPPLLSFHLTTPEVSYTLVSRVYPRAGTRSRGIHFAIHLYSVQKDYN